MGLEVWEKLKVFGMFDWLAHVGGSWEFGDLKLRFLGVGCVDVDNLSGDGDLILVCTMTGAGVGEGRRVRLLVLVDSSKAAVRVGDACAGS